MDWTAAGMFGICALAFLYDWKVLPWIKRKLEGGDR